MHAMQQIVAIARTEFRFGLRRGGPVVVMVLMGLVFSAGALLGPISSILRFHPNPERLAEMGLTIDSVMPIFVDVVSDMSATYGSWAWQLFTIMALFLLPIVTASSIPSDRKFGVLELLRSQPITGGIYLAGKILGVITIVLLIGGITLILNYVILELLFLTKLQMGLPTRLIRLYYQLALLDGLPLLVWASTLGVLAGTGTRSRRAAVVPGLIMGIINVFVWGYAFRPFGLTDYASFHVLHNYELAGAAAITALTGQTTGMLNLISLFGPDTPVNTDGAIPIMYLSIFLIMALFTIIARLWLKWKENF